MRPVIELTVDKHAIVDKPDEKTVQQLYEAFLAKAVHLLCEICQDDTAIIHKTETQRLYNLLMTVVVNDAHKSKKVSSLLGQGFYQLINSPHEDYYVNQGVPKEWSSSSMGSNEDFEEGRKEFADSDDGLKWQWFIQIDYQYSDLQAQGWYAVGYSVGKIDITAG